MYQNELPFSLTPSAHLTNQQAFQHYQCTICYQIQHKNYRCQGSCQKIFCINCLGKIKSIKDTCPSKCSTPLKYQTLPPLPLTYRCPYSSDCNINLNSITQYYRHIQECPFSPIWAQKHFQNIKDFKCGQGHSLSMFTEETLNECKLHVISFYNTVMNDLCRSCGGRGLCRAICTQCSKKQKNRVVYCIECRRLPLTKSLCPLGHLFQVNKSSTFSCFCDLCGVSGPLKEGESYSQYICDVYLCKQCYQSLPEGSKPNKNKNEKAKEKQENKMQSYFQYLDDLLADPFD